MLTRIKSDRLIVGDALFNGYLYLRDGKIEDISAEQKDADICYDFTGRYVSPGWIDIHTHGGGGNHFADSDADEVLRGCDFHLAHGTTSILPTVSASAFDNMMCSLENIKQAMDSGRARSHILGAHLEGPYLSREQCGAQCPDHITPPKKEQYEQAVEQYGAYIKRWTYAPEHDEGGEFCRFIASNGILASVGHSNAIGPDMAKAVESGANLVTHLYSATSTITRELGYRRLGVIEYTFLCDDLYAEIIADGHHLPPELIRLILKIKGRERVIPCTDSLLVAGSDLTSGVMCGTAFIVEDGVAKLPDRSAFAGSVATADVLIRVLTQRCGVSVPDAVYMMTQNPARLLGVNKGSLQAGYDADLVVFDDEIKVEAVFVDGEKRI